MDIQMFDYAMLLKILATFIPVWALGALVGLALPRPGWMAKPYFCSSEGSTNEKNGWRRVLRALVRASTFLRLVNAVCMWACGKEIPTSAIRAY
eukprot:gene7969-1185_t